MHPSRHHPRFQSLLRFACLLAAAPALATAQSPKPILGSLTWNHDRVRFSTAADGSSWARGADYKAGFDASGAQFVPFLGSDAPRDFPVAFQVRSVRVGGELVALESETAPLQQGDEPLRFERGGVSERYQLAPHSMEQSFVFERLPAAGELVLQLAVESELTPAEFADGFVYSNELGGVRYGRATAIDASGARCDAPMQLVEGGIEIRVPADFVARAVLPLTIDPIVQNFFVTTANTDDFSPDVTYDVASDRYVVVWEEVFSATDHDVIAGLIDPSGSLITTANIDASIAYWARPRIASNRASGKCLVVAAVGLPNGGAREIQGRVSTPTPATLTSSAVLHVNGSEAGDRFNPDVGGDPNAAGPMNWCVVWERGLSATQHEIDMQLVDQAGANVFASTLALDGGGTLNQLPSIARSCGPIQRWHVAWQRQVTPTNRDIYGAEITTAGAISIPTAPLETFGSTDSSHPVVSSLVSTPTFGGLWLLTWLEGPTVRIQMRTNLTLLLSTSLQALESTAGLDTTAEDHIEFSADSDGKNFLLAYSESVGGSATNYNTYSLTLTPVGSNGNPLGLFVSEAHSAIGSGATREGSARVCSQASGGGAGVRFMIVDDLDGGATQHHNILGQLFDAQDFTPFCFPGLDAIACPCANAPAVVGKGCNNSSSTGGAKLTESGFASLASDTVIFSTSGEKPTATSILLQGNATANAAFGQGVRCAGGTLKRLYTKVAVAGAIQAPASGDPLVSVRSAALGDVLGAGFQRFYMVYYRDATVLGGCPGASTFNTTTSGAITWWP